MRRNFKRERLKALVIAERYEREANEREKRERPAGYNVYTHEGDLLEGPLPMVIDEVGGEIVSLEEHIGKRLAGAAPNSDV